MARDLLKVTKGLSQKIHPALPETLKAYGEAIKAWKALGPNPPAQLVTEIEVRLKGQLSEWAKRHPEIPVPYLSATEHQDLLSQEEPIDEGKAFAEVIHFNRHMTPLRNDIEAANNGDKKARHRVYRTAQDLLKLHFGEGPLANPKVNLDHLDILKFGIGLGLERLTADELVEFFNTVCWCGGDHDADALKKQRWRMTKTLRNVGHDGHPNIEKA